jgi:hypothetical protein
MSTVHIRDQDQQAVGQPGTRAEGAEMADTQGGGATTGRPALNFERIYGTTVSAEDVARALADHFRTQEFEAQVYRTSENRTGWSGRSAA